MGNLKKKIGLDTETHWQGKSQLIPPYSEGEFEKSGFNNNGFTMCYSI
jgi:hypothetical protein